MRLQLPVPSADAVRASCALQDSIVGEIQAHGGWIGFARFMELALYAPGLGYYSGGSIKLGRDGDFTTAPETSSLFGRTLAHVVAPLLRQSAPRLLEFGAGSGKLARDLLSELARLDVTVESYEIVELSGELRARQREALAGFPMVAWLDALPQGFTGVALGNEVLDAMPVHLVVKTRDGWRERGVGIELGIEPSVESGIANGERRFTFVDRELSELAALGLQQIPQANALPEGYLTEVHPAGSAFIRSLGSMLERGAAVMIDYGFPAHEYYLAQRSTGTLMCHYRHHAHADPFWWPGLQDLTSHVDFSAMATAGTEAGLEVLGYFNQAGFLLHGGLPALLSQLDPTEPLTYLPLMNQVQKLTSPAEMGELFKVLVLGREVELPLELGRADRAHRL